MPEVPKRETRSSIVRGALAELKARKLFEAVRAQAPPDVQAMMDDPPKFLDWVPSHHFETMVVHAGRLAGRDTVREIALALSRASGSIMVLPIAKAVFKVFGTSPASVLRRLSALTYVQHRGMEVTYKPETARSGFVVLCFPEPVDELVFAAWEGAFMFAKDLTGEPNFVVEKFEMSDNGKAGRVLIRW